MTWPWISSEFSTHRSKLMWWWLWPQQLSDTSVSISNTKSLEEKAGKQLSCKSTSTLCKNAAASLTSYQTSTFTWKELFHPEADLSHRQELRTLVVMSFSTTWEPSWCSASQGQLRRCWANCRSDCLTRGVPAYQQHRWPAAGWAMRGIEVTLRDKPQKESGKGSRTSLQSL